MGATPESNSGRKLVRLPKELDSDHAEHLGAAVLALGGMFVEKHVTEKHAKREVTEIDAFGTSWRDGGPCNVLIEAKSGKWDNTQLFALLGKKMYLGADAAALVHTTKSIPEVRRALLARLKDKGLSVMEVNNDDASSPEFVASLCREDEEVVRKRMETIHSHQAWRYSFWT